MIQVWYVIIWWLLLVVIGLIAFPLVSRVCHRLPDRGYSISKLLGLLLITYFSWLLASAHLVKFGYINISISLLLLLALSLYLGRKHLNLRNLPLRSMAISEAIFSVAFVLFLIFLMYKPDIFYAYSEDFMNFGFFQSILRGDYFPPADPWLAGESIPYYYGGHLLVAILTMVSKVPSSVAYNLAVAMFFALVICAAYGLGYNATKRKLYGFITVIFVCIAGYISGAFQLSSYISGHDILGYSAKQGTSFIDWLLTFDLGTQVIPNTGNAYPYSAFLQGDLHANTMSIPFQLMFITLLFALFKRGSPASESSRSDSILNIFILGLSLGFFMFINMWEYPAYVFLTLLAFILLKIDLSKKGLVGVIGLSLLLYLPYLISRGAAGINGIGLVADRTALIEFVEMFALFSFILLTFLFVLLWHEGFKNKLQSIYTSFKHERVLPIRAITIIAIIVIVAALVAVLCDFQLILILMPLILISLYLILKSHTKGETQFMLLLVLTAALVTLSCEIFFIDDAYYVPFERFNTVYKLYFQVWIFLGVASAYAVFWVIKGIRGKSKVIWVALLPILVIACIIQPIGLTAAWTSGRQTVFGVNRGTLDGLAYVKTLDQGDYEGINWINEHIEGSHTILEAPGGAYQFTSRISTMTGLPTVVGWLTHEVMWRGSWDAVAGRDSDVDMIYQTTDGEEAIALLRKYDVEYIYIGTIEKARYETEGLLKFANDSERYELVYQNPEVEIYQVLP